MKNKKFKETEKNKRSSAIVEEEIKFHTKREKKYTKFGIGSFISGIVFAAIGTILTAFKVNNIACISFYVTSLVQIASTAIAIVGSEHHSIKCQKLKEELSTETTNNLQHENVLNHGKIEIEEDKPFVRRMIDANIDQLNVLKEQPNNNMALEKEFTDLDKTINEKDCNTL